jgi:hypothetical protein
MFYVYEIKLHIFQTLSHSIISLFEKVSIENYYCLTFVDFTLLCQPTCSNSVIILFCTIGQTEIDL